MKRDKGLRVAVLVYDGLSILEFGVFCDVFGIDRSNAFGVPWYRFSISAAERGPVRTDTGLELFAHHGLKALEYADIVIVPPTRTLDEVAPVVLKALREANDRGARLISMCTGVFVLAEADLLGGRRATAHWADAVCLARKYPDVSVDANVLYVQDGNVLTSAGGSASIDLCLHVVHQDFGAAVAARLAKELIVPLYREGDQSQVIDLPVSTASIPKALHDTLSWLTAHLDEPISVVDLARRAEMTKRTFARRFTQATGLTTYQWIVRERIRLAQQLLETTDLPLSDVAQRTGFGSSANLRKHFAGIVKVNPRTYRTSFQAR
jgi:transcriptional regulator GlxA family with amidase domain